ncbi:FKBP-type peptidyl-prolyl cis-trans isomerase [Arcanobacterium phocisimile]|uniref:Peptidyl-prolyl cis-trans isomerase n=1 Tax=Arcanobacterium phocisimile TaxID=1302235 RepID=A0ABX7IG60_9ACTO|nr:FKBP-type peptidyl-prolyl cis-trans isomerase [Arcanobacterium phocisimile]QRV01952.1 FKBP-type peptidyl-prolyl cis-trans isomerase [Arcanobacterium phocisimile]
MAVELPTVAGSFGETPEITYPSPDAPRGLKVVMLEEGTGTVVHAGDEVEVNYHGQIWDGELFDSSYFRGEPTRFPIGVGMVIKGWDQALVGKQVGSRVMIVVPPEKGYGPAGNPRAGIKGDDVLVFVVDILGVNQTAFSTHSIR